MQKLKPFFHKIISMCLCVCIALTLGSCALFPHREKIPARYGEAGKNFALEFAQKFPKRYAGSDEEKQAAQYLFSYLQKLGYEPQLQAFSVTYKKKSYTSQNIVVKIKGEGFAVDEPEAKKAGLDKKALSLGIKPTVVIGAHYDTPLVKTPKGFKRKLVADGINDNASGVAALLTMLQNCKEEKFGYDLDIVFFGMGTANAAGADYYLSALEDKTNLAFMINVGPVFAGDKVYAHAGVNSVMGGDHKNYDKRRPLYQVTDVFFSNTLNSYNGYAIYTNQSDFNFTYKLKGKEKIRAPYKEWTVKKSDHTPFDKAGIAVVYLESADYDTHDAETIGRESSLPSFDATDGQISGTPFDSSSYLVKFFKTQDDLRKASVFVYTTMEFSTMHGNPSHDPRTTVTMKKESRHSTTAVQKTKEIERLEQRINNTAFVLIEVCKLAPRYYTRKR